MKKILVVIGIAIAAVVFGLLSFLNLGAKREYFEGALKFADRNIIVYLTLEKPLFGGFSANISIPDQQIFEYPVKHIMADSDSLFFDLSDLNHISIQSKRTKSGLGANWSQQNFKIPVTFSAITEITFEQILVDQMVAYAQQFSLYRNEVNWDSLAKVNYFKIDPNESVNSLITASNNILTVLKDSHGSLILANNHEGSPVKRKYAVHKSVGLINSLLYGNNIETEWLDEHTAYIRIPSIIAFTQEKKNQKAAEIQKAIQDLNFNQSTNWIIDLRLNTGGDFPVMIAGLVDLVGEGSIGTFIDYKDSTTSTIVLKHDGYYQNDNQIVHVTKSPKYENYHPKIAILTSHATASAAEQIIMVIRAKGHTKTFGDTTSGLVTIASTLNIGKKTMFTISTNCFKNKNGVIYKSALKPDIPVDDDPDFGSLLQDGVVVAAMRWFQESK